MNVAVIGGGAAGFMAAITAKESKLDANVVIFEKTKKTLSKVKISGGGRCNVTNATFNISQLIKNYPRGGKELKKSFNIFNTNHTVEWFENRGVSLKTEDDNRMFPSTNTSESIVSILLNTAKDLNVKISLGNKVEHINTFEKGYLISINKKELFFDKIIIATGGSPKSSGLNWLEDLKFSIIDPVPSLFSFNIPKNPITNLMGVSIENAVASIKGSKFKQSGPLLVTHWGLSGPCVLKLSSWAAKELASSNYNFTVQINWLAINEEEVRNYFMTLHSNTLIYKNNPFKIPKRLWHHLLEKVNIPKEQYWNNINKKNRNRLINTLTNDEFIVKGKTTFKEEFVTCGGINLSEVNMETMQSKRYQGIYFAGEILNIDAVTGGFNFQAAWTTGYLAGKNCVL